MSSDGRYNDDAAAPLEQMVFGGTPTEDVTDFLRAVKRVAVIQGRQRDDEWMIDYVESCLKGQAMRWFDTLPPATVESWNQVRRAFLLRFDSPKPADAPVAAAAAAAPFPASIAATSAPRPHSISKPPLPAEVSNVYNGYALESAAVIILGDSGVGKSCWLQRHIGQGWAPWMIPTLGVQYEMFVGSYDGMKYKDCYWDTSGAEENQALIARYCQGISVAYLVYDVTNATSFWNIRTWHQMIKQHASQDIYLIGNKIDLKDKRVVQTQDGKRLAAELGVTLFYEVSAKSNEGIRHYGGAWLPFFKK